MTDFVLEQSEKIKKEKYGIESYYNTMQVSINYANFLKHLLKLEMFVPCDENGNILEDVTGQGMIPYYVEKVHSFLTAKEKVLFKVFKISVEKNAIINNEKTIIRIHKNNNFSS